MAFPKNLVYLYIAISGSALRYRILAMQILIWLYKIRKFGDRHGRDCMVVGFSTTYAISTYHHERCEFESRSWKGVLDANTSLSVIW